MAAAAGSTNTLSTTALAMKLLVESSPLRQRVVFAEAGKDTVDFLFSLLAMPAGTAVKLLGKESMAGCMGNLYGSAERLDDAYVHPGPLGSKDDVLCATVPLCPPAAGPKSCLLFRVPQEPTPAPAPAPKRFYVCPYTYNYSGCGEYVTEVKGTRCPSCGNQMTKDTNFVGSPPEPAKPPAEPARRGFVKGAVTYTVTDDLVISPMSNVSTIALLNACAIRDIGALQERTVHIGYKEVGDYSVQGLEILKASLQSKTVLTDVFLGKKPPSMNNNNNGGNRSMGSGRRHECLTWRA